jgi:ABC-type histidine transport system ATPase subunit
MQPKVILFDEPTSALDPELVAEVLAVIADLAREGRTLVIVTHQMAFAKEVAGRTLFMDGGRVVEDGPSREMLENPQSERLRRFLGRVL